MSYQISNTLIIIVSVVMIALVSLNIILLFLVKYKSTRRIREIEEIREEISQALNGNESKLNNLEKQGEEIRAEFLAFQKDLLVVFQILERIYAEKLLADQEDQPLNDLLEDVNNKISEVVSGKINKTKRSMPSSSYKSEDIEKLIYKLKRDLESNALDTADFAVRNENDERDPVQRDKEMIDARIARIKDKMK